MADVRATRQLLIAALAFATGERLHAIDLDDLAGVWPGFGRADQTGADGIFADVIPLFGIALIGAEDVVEEAALPDGIFACRPDNRFAEVWLKEAEPRGEIELRVATDEKMNVIGHDHVSTDGDVVLGVGALAEHQERVLHCARSEVWPLPVAAERDEIDRVRSEDELKSSWRSGEAHVCIVAVGLRPTRGKYCARRPAACSRRPAADVRMTTPLSRSP